MSETANGDLDTSTDSVLDLVSFITVNLVDHPDDVLVGVVEKQGRQIYQVRVHADDLGKVIGKGGQTARAIRTLLMAVSARCDRRLGLEILE